MKGFLSDNTASVHPDVMKKLVEVNFEHAMPYGADDITARAKEIISELFDGAYTTFVLNGTGANVVGLDALIDSYNAVICADTAHINVDECGAFEKLTSAKIVTVPSADGKLRVDDIRYLLDIKGNEHHSQPKVISISQLTECGTAYTVDEIRALSDFAHANDMYLHIDGARIANAIVATDSSFKEMIKEAGVDMLSFGGAKNGLMYGEAILCFDEKIHDKLRFYRKQSAQLMSKMRYISAQYIALLENELWRENASSANKMMKILSEELVKIKGINADYNIDGNILFISASEELTKKMAKCGAFYSFPADENGVVSSRLVTSFDTTLSEVEDFLNKIKALV